jgi:hypothetical protein
MKAANSDEEPQSRLLRWLLYLFLLLLSFICVFLAAQLGTSMASDYRELMQGSMVSKLVADYSPDADGISFAPLDEAVIIATAEDENGLKRKPTGDGAGVPIAAVPPTARPTPVIPPPALAPPPPTQPVPPAPTEEAATPPPATEEPPAPTEEPPPATEEPPAPTEEPPPPTEEPPAPTEEPPPPPPTEEPPPPPPDGGEPGPTSKPPPPPPPPPPPLPPRPSPPPRVLAVNPLQDDNDAAVNIVINGTNFVANPTAYLVDGGATALATTYVSPTTLNAVIPAWFTADFYDLRVTNPDLQSGTLTNAFTLTNPIPLITGVNPDNGPDNADTAIIINGSNFVNGLTANLDGFPLAVTFVDSSTLNTTVPCASSVMPAGPYTLTIANPGPLNPTGNRADAFTVTIPPGSEYGGVPACDPGVSNCGNASGAPDGNIAGIPVGEYLTFTLPAGSGIRDGPGYDFVFFEHPNPPGIHLDWVVVEVSDDGFTWQQVLNWGNNITDTNTNVAPFNFNEGPPPGPPPTGELDNEQIPSGALWSNTGVAIDISIIGPPPGSQYRYVRFGCPAGGADDAQVDAIQRLH